MHVVYMTLDLRRYIPSKHPRWLHQFPKEVWGIVRKGNYPDWYNDYDREDWDKLITHTLPPCPLCFKSDDECECTGQALVDYYN